MTIAPAYRYRAKAVRVIDGDTLVLSCDLGFRCAVEIEGRIRGVDTPELPSAEGVAAREFVGSLVLATPLVVESWKDRRSFARWVVDCYLPDGRSLADAIIAAGHGEPA
jgi:endonuclease YncB( thermonuclease family)